MAGFTVNTTRPVRFLRRFSGNMEPPVYTFPVDENDTSTAVYAGNLFLFEDTGKVTHADGASGFARPGDGAEAAGTTGDTGIAGFAIGASAGAPPFPTSGGASANGLLFTTPSSMTTNDPIPETEKVALIITLPDCLFLGNLGTSSSNVEADYDVSTRTILNLREGLSVSVAAVDYSLAFVDVGATTANTVRIIDYHYPKMKPTARSTTGQGDPWKMVSATQKNAEVVFHVIDSQWSSLA